MESQALIAPAAVANAGPATRSVNCRDCEDEAPAWKPEPHPSTERYAVAASHRTQALALHGTLPPDGRDAGALLPAAARYVLLQNVNDPFVVLNGLKEKIDAKPRNENAASPSSCEPER